MTGGIWALSRPKSAEDEGTTFAEEISCKRRSAGMAYASPEAHEIGQEKIQE